MKRETLSIVLSCMLGAFIGALVALQLGGYFWFIGAILGGAVAYIAVDFRDWAAAFRYAWRRTIAWRPYSPYWKTLGVALVSGICVMPTIIAATYLLIVFVAFASGVRGHDFSVILTGPLVAYISLFLAFMLGAFLALPEVLQSVSFNLYEVREKLIGRTPTRKGYKANLLAFRKKCWGVAKWGNLASVLFLSVFGVVGGVVYCIIKAPRITAATWRGGKVASILFFAFARYMFLYAHSSRRVLCFTDAALGAAAGYQFGSALAGAVIGGALGLLNYELVSVRWLGLAPYRARK
ncbi:MAG: hypothetical protein HYT29_00910 [Parcubacteria group bacterium]|nr:hypothetical protein [Parcubacteria group bacterium]